MSSISRDTDMQFISDEDFEALAARRRFEQEAICWKDLPTDGVFRVNQVLPVQTKWGGQLLLLLINNEGYEIKVWSPHSVKKELKNFDRIHGITYIKSLGEKERITNTGKRKYYDFEVVLT